jgi:large repetitive protein
MLALHSGACRQGIGPLRRTVVAVATFLLMCGLTASAANAAIATRKPVGTPYRAAHLGIGLTDTAGSSALHPGGPVVYTIVVANAGPGAAGDMRVADVLPAQGLDDITSPNLPPGWTFNAADNSWSIAKLAKRAGTKLFLSGTVPASATGSTYVNEVTASAIDAKTVSKKLTSQLRWPAILTLTFGGTTPVIPGQTATYDVTVGNTGPMAAPDVTVVETPPAQGFDGFFTFSGQNMNFGLPGGVTFNSQTDTWTIATIGAGDKLKFIFGGGVPASATGGTYVNELTASAANAASVTASFSSPIS